MHIICPHCTTSYAIDLATLGAAGRPVRCSRCKGVWLARPQGAVVMADPAPAVAEGGAQNADADAAAEWEAMAREDDSEAQEIPVVDSPPISGDGDGSFEGSEADWPSIAQPHAPDAVRPHRRPWFRKLLRPPAMLGGRGGAFVSA